MRIAKQTPTLLIVKTNERRLLLTIGAILLLVGLLITIVVRIQPLNQRELHLSSLFYYQQEGAASFEPEAQQSSVADTGFRLAYYVGRLSFTRERPIVALALVSIIAGFIIVVGPSRSETTTFDKAQQQVMLQQPGWFFRSKVESHPFQKVSEVRVERDRSNTRKGQNFGVSLVINQSEGIPLSRNYIHYKTVYPLSGSYDYDYESAKNVVEQIQKFMTKA